MALINLSHTRSFLALTQANLQLKINLVRFRTPFYTLGPVAILCDSESEASLVVVYSLVPHTNSNIQIMGSGSVCCLFENTHGYGRYGVGLWTDEEIPTAASDAFPPGLLLNTLY